MALVHINLKAKEQLKEIAQGDLKAKEVTENVVRIKMESLLSNPNSTNK
jgi:hypothetical protein